MKIVATSLAHDSSACYLEDGQIKYWCKQERLSRIKRQPVPFLPLLEIERRFDLTDVDFYVSSAPFQEAQDRQIAEACSGRRRNIAKAPSSSTAPSLAALCCNLQPTTNNSSTFFSVQG